ncbi:MAG TPA: hypothetical protein VGH02_00485 [Rhizomicrobium sp.]
MRGAVFVALTLLSGCGIFGPSTPDLPPGQSFTYNGNSWRVADDRGAGRLEISAVDPRLTGMGTIADKRHEVSTMPKSEYRAAAMGWFATTGRFCNLDDGVAADAGGYDYSYSCWIPA